MADSVARIDLFTKAYAFDILKLAIPGFVMATLSFFTYYGIGICRLCDMSCCAYKYQCCSVPRPKTYKKRNTVFVLRASTIAIWVLIGLAQGYGFRGNDTVGDSVTTNVAYLDKMVFSLQRTANESYSQILRLNADEEGRHRLEPSFVRLTKDVSSMTSMYADNRGQILKTNHFRFLLIEVSFVLPIILLLLVSIGSNLPLHTGSFVGTVYLFTSSVLFLIWISFAVHLPVSQIVSDTCGWVNDSLASTNSDDNPLAACLTTGSYFSVWKSVNQELYNTMEQLQSQLNPYINITTVRPVPHFDDPINESTVNFITNQLTFVSNNLDSLPNETARQFAEREIDRVSLYVQVVSELARLAKCDDVLALFFRLKANVCGPLIRGLREIAWADVGIGLLLFPAAVLTMVVFYHKPDWVHVIENGIGPLFTETVQLASLQNSAQ